VRKGEVTLLAATILCSTMAFSRMVNPSASFTFWCPCSDSSNSLISVRERICSMYIFSSTLAWAPCFSRVSSAPVRSS